MKRKTITFPSFWNHLIRYWQFIMIKWKIIPNDRNVCNFFLLFYFYFFWNWLLNYHKHFCMIPFFIQLRQAYNILTLEKNKMIPICLIFNNWLKCKFRNWWKEQISVWVMMRIWELNISKLAIVRMNEI